MAVEALSQLRLRRSTTTRAVITHYALLLEGFWTNPLTKVGEAPILPLTGYKACSYLPQAVIMLRHIRDTNQCLLHYVTYAHMTPTAPTTYNRLTIDT